MDKGLLICGHGSRKAAGTERFREFAEQLLSRHGSYIGGHAFMEISEPDFRAGISSLYHKGAREITALPAFLFSGTHMANDVPSQLRSLEAEFPGLRIKLASYIGASQKLIDLAAKRIEEAEAGLPETYSRQDTCLVPVAVGTSLPVANGEIANASLRLWERTRFGYSMPAFVSKLAFPALPQVLDAASALPCSRIMVQIMILFEGVYHDIIRQHLKKFVAKTGKEVIITQPLGYDTLIFEAIGERLQEAESGAADLMRILP
jgi:sirohydrochlorin cobaltochelatase